MAIIKGFIFDLDGVLVDTAGYHFQAWKRVADELGIRFSEKDNEQLKGVSRADSLHKILALGQKEISEERFEELMEFKNQCYLDAVEHMDENELLPGARDFLEACQENNLRIGLGSASQNARLILEKVNISRYFDVIVDGTMTTTSKPDPQVFQLGAEAMELEPASLVVFEDGKAGIEAAINGGFRCVGVGSKKILKKAEMVIKSLDAVTPAEVINQLNF